MAKRHSAKMPNAKRSAPVYRLSLFGVLSKKMKHMFISVRKRAKPGYKNVLTLTQKHPFLSFFTALGLLLLIIISGNISSKLGIKSEERKELVKKVKIYSIGESPKIALQAQVEQEGVVEIVAQMPGIVQEVQVSDGQHVSTGQTLVSLSTNYQGGSAPSLQAQLAGAQYKNVQDTFNAQKDLIGKQKELTEKTNNNTEELRKISEDAKTNTKGLLDQNETILNTLSDQLETLEQSGATPDQLLQDQQAKAQAQSGVNQLRNTLKNLEYTTNINNPPTQLANLQKDISLKQLDLQEKALLLSKETSRIQYNIALVTAALMQPAAPFGGTVERIMVAPGESVSTGTVIAIISNDNPKATLSLMVPQEIAQNISRATPSIIHIGKKQIMLSPSYVSTVPTKSLLYSVLYTLPTEYISKAINKSYITVEAPIGYADTLASVPFIPIDSVFQSQNSSYVFVEKNNKVVSKTIKLGTVYGSYVEVSSGIQEGDKIILNRNVVSGEKIEIDK
ncbi:MAG: biotin/lipoyl-binding protein [Candidatus Levybacteria bacterium]|nr:biotin/lipoyl-binding protein [Candidatus Levybacteria bacterium]MBP9814812.1 biotin/lipoyl-binding protein [Candidatus Levybacteria bacterium]